MAQMVLEITTQLEPILITIIKSDLVSAKLARATPDQLFNTIMIQIRPRVQAAVSKAISTHPVLETLICQFFEILNSINL